ncbi:VOC family protein [Streptomyces sp. NPDC013953]|uniref:VOC family protein n=1 Tax=Streptomyces sp. NPDC013953 TaxID=3364868 RepID=UPI0036FE3972
MLTTRDLDGAPTWLDLATPDLAGAESFYAGLFGWTLTSQAPAAGAYGVFRHDGKAVAGIRPVPPAAPSQWTLYFRTRDADATTRAVRAGGGTVDQEPAHVSGLGRTALCTDPAGAGFAVLQTGTGPGFGAVDEPGALCWTELHTRDVPSAMAFYGAVLGVDSATVPLPDGTGSYLLLTPPGAVHDTSFGGVVPLAADPSGTGPHWTPYIEVPDPDATAARTEQLGGTVRLPPTDLDGIGRLARLTDPHGARFAVIHSGAPGG